MIPRSVLILTGQSGSGKSTAIRTLEDHGFFCVDNMPTSLVEQLVETLFAEGSCSRLALVMDIRERSFLTQAPALIARLRAAPTPLRMIFLEAKEEVMIRRYSETRRLHPLDRGLGLRDALAAERALLAPLRELADEALDTSHMSPHRLRQTVASQIAGISSDAALRIGLLSFGFKHGVPLEADIVLDVRFLPNPYFVAELREQTGEVQAVSQYVLQAAEAQTFLQHSLDFLRFLVPQYQREGKRYLTVALGCTGGKHRSVAMVIEIAARLQALGMAASLRHRDASGLK
jgi:UPF0042 nucleotide-binding protein